MPKWKKDATEFTVGINYHPTRGAACSVPKPVVEVLGKPSKVTYIVKGKKVELKPADNGP
ncbi:MAG: hypothetical protein JRM73_04760 [Nitrososphaerota archaeon]|nr:hypothetical protein [Nitrososphaerota archaeon]